MTLLTAHKILISSAIALFVFYGAFEARQWLNGDGSAIFRSLASLAGTAGFALYLRSVFRQSR